MTPVIERRAAVAHARHPIQGAATRHALARRAAHIVPPTVPSRPGFHAARSHRTVAAMPSSTSIWASPAEQLAGLLDRGPAPLHVDGEGRQVLERERIGVLAARLPDDARDLGDRQLARGGDVEVLVQARRRAHRGDDAVGDVVDVRERPASARRSRRSRAGAGRTSTLRIRSGTAWAMPGSASGSSPGP